MIFGENLISGNNDVLERFTYLVIISGVLLSFVAKMGAEISDPDRLEEFEGAGDLFRSRCFADFNKLF